jgi:hypothetical protein
VKLREQPLKMAKATSSYILPLLIVYVITTSAVVQSRSSLGNDHTNNARSTCSPKVCACRLFFNFLAVTRQNKSAGAVGLKKQEMRMKWDIIVH